MDVDQHLATIFQQVAALFVFAEKRTEMIATDRIQSLDEFEVPEYGYLRDELSADLFHDELATMNALTEELAALLDNEEYYAYAVALPEIINYLTKRRQLQVLSKNDPEPGDSVTVDTGSGSPKGAGSDDTEGEETTLNETHPLVKQAEQLADFVTEPELEANLRKSVGLYHYCSRDPEIATEFLSDARELAIESGETALEDALDDQIERIEDVPNPYDTSQYDEDDDRDRQEMAKKILEIQGIEVDLEDPPDPYEADPMTVMGYHAVRDADPEPLYRHCEHLHLAYSPSEAGKLLGMGSFGSKYLWCQHGGFKYGTSLTDMFDQFKSEYCDGCNHHCPRPDDWEFSKDLEDEVEVVRYDPTLKSRVVPHSLHLDGNRTRYIDTESDETVGEDGYSHDVNFMYVPADRDDWVVAEAQDIQYTVFTTNRDDVAAVDAPGFVDRYSKRWDIEIEYKMIQPMVPSIASRDYRMRYFSFIFSCLLYNLWRLVDHSLKVLVTEAYDDYGRSSFDERLDPLLPMADLLASSLILFMLSDGLDPPD
ncbi:hypothetical protein [Halobacterium salinarum]|nr:hypothetical protein [Halobacterium salinarum]